MGTVHAGRTLLVALAGAIPSMSSTAPPRSSTRALPCLALVARRSLGSRRPGARTQGRPGVGAVPLQRDGNARPARGVPAKTRREAAGWAPAAPANVDVPEGIGSARRLSRPQQTGRPAGPARPRGPARRGVRPRGRRSRAQRGAVRGSCHSHSTGLRTALGAALRRAWT